MHTLSVGGLEIEELVVTSGFSQVWRAWDPWLQRKVALKVFHLTPEKEADLPYPREVWLRRFVAEARLLAAIDNPFLVRVDTLARLADGTPYIRMPWYVANLRREIGQDVVDEGEVAALPPLQRPRAVPPARAAELMRQICLGLAALHAKGFVHRDVKPTNMLLTERENGVIKICDLGMAKLPDELSRALARKGVWIGTPDYAAPEQMEDASQVDDRADVYSAGIVGYRLLAGRLPVAGPEDLADLVPGLPAEFVRVVAQAMATQPSQRPTALQMAAMLTDVLYNWPDGSQGMIKYAGAGR